MEALLDGVLVLAQIGAAGVMFYGFVLATRVDGLLSAALRAGRGEGVGSSRPAHMIASAA
jgi:hypothetical protein